MLDGDEDGDPDKLGKRAPVGPGLGKALGMVDAMAEGSDDGEALGKGPLLGSALGKTLGMVDAVTVGNDEGK